MGLRRAASLARSLKASKRAANYALQRTWSRNLTASASASGPKLSQRMKSIVPSGSVSNASSCSRVSTSTCSTEFVTAFLSHIPHDTALAPTSTQSLPFQTSPLPAHLEKFDRGSRGADGCSALRGLRARAPSGAEREHRQANTPTLGAATLDQKSDAVCAREQWLELHTTRSCLRHAHTHRHRVCIASHSPRLLCCLLNAPWLQGQRHRRGPVPLSGCL